MAKLIKYLFPIVILASSPLTVFCQTPKEIENELLRHFEKLEQASNYGGSGNKDIQDAENKAIRAVFIKHGRRIDVLRFSFSSLRKKIFISTSQDGRHRPNHSAAKHQPNRVDSVTEQQERRDDGQ